MGQEWNYALGKGGTGVYRKDQSLGTLPRLTFQARLLHNQEGANAEKGGFQKISSRGFFFRNVSVGVHIPLIVEQSSLESQVEGVCAKTPILMVFPLSAFCRCGQSS